MWWLGVLVMRFVSGVLRSSYERASRSFSSDRLKSISDFGPARQMLLCSESLVSHP